MKPSRIQFLMVGFCLLIVFLGHGQDEAAAQPGSVWERSGLIAEDLAIVLGGQKGLTEERRSRILLMAEAAYRANENAAIWSKTKVLADFSAFDSLLEAQGLSKEGLWLDTKVASDLVGLRNVLPIKDLHKTLRLAEYCVLLRDGPESQSASWDRWVKGNHPGKGNLREQTYEMRQAFADALVSKSSIEVDLPKKFIPSNWVYTNLWEKYNTRPGQSKLDQIEFPSGLRPGWSFADAALLADYLVEKGFLDKSLTKDIKTTYSKPLSDGVAALQASLGLNPDGVIGPQTLSRIRNSSNNPYWEKLRLNLNRARLLPNKLGKRYLVANIPSGEIYGFEDDKLAVKMRIVFGAPNEKHKTPFFRDDMTSVIFCPYWMLPNEIARNEYLPKIRRDPSYMGRNGYKIVDYTGKVYPSNNENLNQVYNGDLYLRQEGGSTNALGRVKFIFPNENYIYFHDTPEKQFFQRDYRAQSHGCVRLQYPASMAEWVLQDIPEWDINMIHRAMWSGSRLEVKLYQSIPVYITYLTHFPNPEKNDEIRSHPDYYGMD